MYIFSTRDIQGLIQAVALISFLALINTNLEKSPSYQHAQFVTKARFVLLFTYPVIFVLTRIILFWLGIISAITVLDLDFIIIQPTLSKFN